MSLDSSLKSSSGLVQHRNVLTRAERIEYLTERTKFNADEGHSPLGLVKVANRKLASAKSAKKKEAALAEAEGGGEGGAPETEETPSVS